MRALRRSSSILLALILAMATPLFSPLAHAQSYNPGVSVSQYVTFGQIGVTFKGSGSPPSFVSQLNQTQSLTTFSVRVAIMSVAGILSSKSTYQRTETMKFSFQPVYPDASIPTDRKSVV